MFRLVFLSVVIFASMSFGSYRTKVCALRGTTDTLAVTLTERIDYCIKENSAKILRGEILKAAFINTNQFTDPQLTEFSLRGLRGTMTQLMIPAYTSDAAVNTAGNAVTDAQLDNIFIYVVWIFARLIGTGSL